MKKHDVDGETFIRFQDYHGPMSNSGKSSKRSKRKLKVDADVRFRAYNIIEQAVERGFSIGWKRAHKHSDKPDEGVVEQHVSTAIMTELGEVMEYGPPDNE